MWITKQILAFLFCFARGLNLYTPLISILPPTYPPLPSPSAYLSAHTSHTAHLSTHPSAHPSLRNQPFKDFVFIKPLDLTLLSARVTYDVWASISVEPSPKKPTLKIPPSKAWCRLHRTNGTSPRAAHCIAPRLAQRTARMQPARATRECNQPAIISMNIIAVLCEKKFWKILSNI
jgi:hypothetical protein